METKPLLFGLIGFFIGGLLVAVAATTFDKPQPTPDDSMMSISMDDMAAGLRNKTGDEFDRAFLSGMIVHHQGAVAMAELADKNAKHAEVKRLSRDIISAQKDEIAQMRQWQTDWGYSSGANDSAHGMH